MARPTREADPRRGRSGAAVRRRGRPGRPDPITQAFATPVGGRGSVVSSNYDGQFRGDYEYVAGSGDLDECNGMVVNGQYGYFITDAYPWVLGCYSGTPDESFSMAMGPPPGR